MLCDIGAAEVLLPMSTFRKEINDMELSLNNLISIANKYDASLEAVLLRSTEVTEKPCAMGITSFTGENILRVDYFKASKSFKSKLNKGFEIPTESKAYECVNAGWTSSEREKWISLGNSYCDFSFIGLGPLKKQNVQRVGMFIVPKDDLSTYELNNINYILGDATQPRGEGKRIIAQVVNTSLGFGFGFGRAMAKRFPESIKVLKEWKNSKSEFGLGNSKLTELDDNIYVFHMIAQEGIRSMKGKIPLRYESLRKCLRKLGQEAKLINASIHMPAIGSGQAHGDWSMIEGIIYEELILKDLDVTVYKLPGTEIEADLKHNQTLFDEE